MWSRTVIFVLSLAAIGTYGCAPVSFRSLPNRDQAKQATNVTPPMSAPAPASPALLALIRQQDIVDENLFAPILISQNELPLKAEKLEPVEDPATKASKAPEEALTALQRVPGSHTDDRLLDLVEKDLQKAVEQPNEGRRLQFSKAVMENPRVHYFINYFSKRQKEPFAKALARSGKYFTMMAKVLREEGLPEDFVYIALVESYFSPHAFSRAGAVGLWQFVPATARKYGLKIDRWIDERRDPIKSTRAAAAYLKDLHRAFDRWYFATAAYNAGQGAMEKVMQSARPKNFAALIEKTKLSAETRNFLPKFVAAALIAANPEKYGFGHVVRDAQFEYEEVEVQGDLQLASVADMAATDNDTLRELNPALLHSQTPPGENRYTLRLPAGHASTFELAYGRSREAEEAQMVMHEVKRGETLFSIARRYGQQVRALMELNGLTDSRLRIGQKLKIIFEGLRGTLR